MHGKSTDLIWLPFSRSQIATRYPFHLKPKSAQLAYCVRMAADIIHELGLDENFLASNVWGQRVTEEKLDKIRAYLAYVYLVST